MGIKTIIGALGLSDITGDPKELKDYIDAEVAASVKEGDLLGAGEWLANKVMFCEPHEVEEAFTGAVCFWASPQELKAQPKTITELLQRAEEYVPEDLAVAAVAMLTYTRRSKNPPPQDVAKFVYRLEKPIRTLFELPATRNAELLTAAATALEGGLHELQVAVRAFTRTNCVTAKRASLDLVKKERQIRRMVLPAERPMVTALDGLLGATFRRFCECYEQQNATGLIGTARDLREQAIGLTSGTAKQKNSTLWNVILKPVANHVEALILEGSERSEVATTPALRLAPATLKLDLSRANRQMPLVCRLLNTGDGRAVQIKMKLPDTGLDVELELLDPTGPFDIDGASEQLITLGITLNKPLTSLELPVAWECQTIAGKGHVSSDKLVVGQQHTQPDWAKLLQSPPYSLNPVKRREDLYGRDEALTRLLLSAANGTSTFLWGHKRVGKTSVLQVLAAEMDKRENFVSIVLRMGEVAALHEGQIAHLIAQRLHAAAGSLSKVPAEQAFGAGLGTLIPVVETLTEEFPNTRFVVTIDEFDDLNPAFYTGERGRLFVKALRSLSEVGLTFCFVGSERMNTIYRLHESELNKWANESLDRIESREHCKALITQPLAGAIEYQKECVDFLIDYCDRNPFYIHQLCRDLFQRCFSEGGTFVSETMLRYVQRSWLNTIGPTTFAHFWDDNPELNEVVKRQQSAENCLVLTCIAALGGSFHSVDELSAKQDALALGPSERMSEAELRTAVQRLVRRRVLNAGKPQGKTELVLPIFGDWLKKHAEVQLLPRWREHVKAARAEMANSGISEHVHVSEEPFLIGEEELLAVSQSMVYCGRQKDAAEIRVWLRQFDDNVRIEIAFLLLKRLAERGFVTEGAVSASLEKIHDAVLAKRREVGRGAWTMFKNRRDNLCITFVDADMKSGATTARELAKRLRPGKQGPPSEILGWMKSRAENDAIVAFVDDFAASGKTISDGLRKFEDKVNGDASLRRYFGEGRVFCFLLYALPEALEKLKTEHPDIGFVAGTVFGEEVRAFDEQAGLFESEEDLRFAREVMMQIGRELYPAYPLGFGDVGALVCFQNTIPNNTLPIFWCSGTVAGKPWKPLFPRA